MTSELGGELNHAHRELAHLIIRRLIEYFEGDSGAIDELVDELQNSGASADVIREALEMLLRESLPETEELVPPQKEGAPSQRVLSARERESMTAEAYGYLLGLVGDGRLRSEHLEDILGRLEQEEIPADLDRVQELAWQVTLESAENEGEHGPRRFVN